MAKGKPLTPEESRNNGNVNRKNRGLTYPPSSPVNNGPINLGKKQKKKKSIWDKR